MRDLGPELNRRVRELVKVKYSGEARLTALINAAVGDDADFEHVITFLDESVSHLHREFASDLRRIFESVLRERLAEVEDDHGGTPPVGLYESLLDMYSVPGIGEELGGMLTLNYDEFLELAFESAFGRPVDLGVTLHGVLPGTGPKLLKLHGSLGWRDEWPIARSANDAPLWIPPGIQKAKDRYPFNLLWGMARELLDCDALRIVGCRLGPSDWDLISLLFTTRHTSASGKRYRIEVIDSPLLAEELKERFPYLEVKSILELEPVGRHVIAEFIGGSPRPFSALGPDEQKKVFDRAKKGENWFRVWLTLTAESVFTNLGSVETSFGAFKRLLEN